MTYDEALHRFGLPASPSDHDEIRHLLAEEVELACRWEDREEMLRTLCVLLFSLGVVEDSLLIWAAKQFNFDAGFIVDVQFLCGAGLLATEAFLARSSVPEAAEALRYLTKCKDVGDFDRFPPETCIAEYRRYYGLPST